MSDGTLFNTTDFYTTAVLISKEFEIKEISNEGPQDRVKRFHFEDTPELRKTILSYMNRQLVGNLRQFKDAIESVKDIVHSA